MKRNFWVLMIVAVVVGGAAWYIHRAKVRALNSGSASVREQTGGRTRLQTSGTAAQGQTARPEQAGADNAAQTAEHNEAAAPGEGGPPASDSIRRNPPNGTVFADTGKYQLYRQGDITWRLDTQTGAACILFATEAQWRKTLVYNHGCGAV